MIKKYITRDKLEEYFQTIIETSGYTFIKKDCDFKNFLLYKLQKGDKTIDLFINLRNVCSAFIPNKPYIFRRQVHKIPYEQIPENTNNELSILIGIWQNENALLLVAWNPFYFVGHSTNRSCYVLDSSLKAAKDSGFYFGLDCKTPVYVCDKHNFEKLLEEYVERNVVE